MKKINCFTWLLAFAMLAVQSAVFAGATVSLNASKDKVQAGETFTVDVNIATDTDLTNIFAVVLWDYSKLELTSCEQVAAYADEDSYYTSFKSESADGVAYVGVADANGGKCLSAGFDDKMATLTFKVLEGVEPTDVAVNLSKNPADAVPADGVSGTICAQDPDLADVEMTVTGTSISVVRLFNVSSAESSIADWSLGTSAQIALGNMLEYTDENGDAYAAGGKVTAIDNANITVKVGGAEAAYTVAKFGKFTLSTNNDGTVMWDGKVTEVIGHSALEFVIPFTATSKDAKAYKDTNTFTLTVTPANTAPVVSNFAIVTDGDYAMSETKTVKFSFAITDADGDETNPVNGTVKLNGETLAGTFANEKEAWTFTATEALSQDVVSHTVTDKTADGVHVLAWEITFDVTDGIATVASEQASGNDKNTWIKDVDRAQGDPKFNSFSPSEPKTTDDITAAYGETTDADGDEITYSVKWTSGNKTYTGDVLPAAQTAKGEEWTPTVIATTKPYGKDVVTSVNGPSITIKNTAPTLAGRDSLFIRMVQGQETVTGSIEFTIDDADENDQYEVSLTNGAKGTVSNSEMVNRKFTVVYTVTDPTTEFENDTFTVKVNDDTDDSNVITVSVTYKDNPPAAIEVVTDAPAEPVDEVDAEGAASEFVLKIKATDATEVAPYGIKAIAWTVADGSGLVFGTETSKTNAADGSGNYVTEDEMEVIVKTKGYETLNGKDRAASAAYVVTVEVEDALGAKTTQEFTVTVADKDRAASAPSNMDVVTIGENKTGTTYKLSARGAEDPDGDDVKYVYALYVDGELKETSEATAPGTDYTTTTAMVKGQKAELKAKAVSKPAYEGGVEVESDEYTTGELDAIENSAPVVTVPEGDGAVAIDEYVEGYNEAAIEMTIGAEADVKFAYEDIDEAAKADNVTLTVNGDGLEGYATIAYEDGKLTITRELNKNTAGLEELPYFTVIATDESGDAAEAKFYLTINPINEKPSVNVSDIYVPTGDAEFEAEFVVNFGESDDEDDQAIANILDVAIEDEAGLVSAYEVVASEDGKSVIVKGTINENADAGASAVIKFKVQDNGGTPFEDTSDEISMKIAVGSTPWYPTIALSCTEHPIHEVKIIGGGKTITLIVEGDMLLPADYYNQGCKGLDSDTEYDIECRAWTAADGAAEETCEELEMTTSTYDLPGKATVVVADDNKTFTVTAPMAAKYTVIIKKDGKVFKTISKDFTPDEEGNILTVAEFEQELFEAGEYEITAFGTNPKGDGEVSDVFELAIEDAAGAILEWPDGAFSPDEMVIYIAENAKSATVNFNWPVVSAADKYVLCIQNAAAKSYDEVELSENTATYTFKVAGDTADISWWVIAVDKKGREVSSDNFAFSIVRQTTSVSVTGVYIAEDGDSELYFAIEGEGTVFTKADIQVAHVTGNMVYWYKAMGAAVEEGDGYATVTINGATISAGDIVYVRTYNNGKAGDWAIYSVKADD